MCVLCYEEMPCAVLSGKSDRPAIEEDSLHEQLEASRVEAERRRARAERLKDRLIQMGLPIDVPVWAVGFTISMDDLERLVSLVPEDAVWIEEE